MAYTKTNWSNGEAPAINETNLNKIEQGIYDATYVDGVKVGTSIDSNYKTNIIMSKNLLPTNINTYTENGITITNNGNGTITLNGTCTSGFGIYMNVGLQLKAGTYTNSVNLIKNGVYLSLDNINTTMIVPPATSKTFTIANDTSYARYLIWIDTNVSFNNEVIKMQIEKGSIATTFEAYITPTINVYGEDIYVKGQNEVYSTQEQRIGTWINGKPLYRRVLESSSITLNDGVVLSTISNIDKVCNMRGMISSSTGFNQPIGMIYIDTFDRNNYIWLDKGTGEVKYRLKSGWTAINYIMVVVEYTKTTD